MISVLHRLQRSRAEWHGPLILTGKYKWLFPRSSPQCIRLLLWLEEAPNILFLDAVRLLHLADGAEQQVVFLHGSILLLRVEIGQRAGDDAVTATPPVPMMVQSMRSTVTMCKARPPRHKLLPP